MLDCAERFRKATGMPGSEIGQRSLNDQGFLSQVEAGRNIRFQTFETFRTWLDVHWQADSSFAVATRGAVK